MAHNADLARAKVHENLEIAEGATVDINGTMSIAGTAVTTSAAELNVLDTATAGSVLAGKAVVADSNKDVSGFRDVGVRYLKTTGNVGTAGTASAGTIVATEYGDGTFHQTVLALTGAQVAVTRETGDSSGWGTLNLYDFPEGRLAVFGVVASLTVTGGANIAATGSGDFSLGTTATEDTTLDGTDVDLCPSTGLTDPFAARVGSGSGALAAAATAFDGTTTAKGCHLNLIFDAGDVSTGNTTATVTGTVTITWTKLGDY